MIAGQGVAVIDATSEATASVPVMPVADVTVEATADTGVVNATCALRNPTVAAIATVSAPKTYRRDESDDGQRAAEREHREAERREHGHRGGTA